MRTNSGVLPNAQSRPTPAVGVLTETLSSVHDTFGTLEDVASMIVNKLGISSPPTAAGNAAGPVSLLDSTQQAASRAQNLLDTLVSINNVL